MREKTKSHRRLKALRQEGYATRNRRRPEALQHSLFPYLEVL